MNIQPNTGHDFTGFMAACHENHIEIVKLLIQNGVNMETKNNKSCWEDFSESDSDSERVLLK